MATPPIVDADTRNDYTASGGQTVFSYTFWAKAESDIDVYVNNVQQTLTTDYTISAVQNANGGDITFVSGLTNGDAVAIVYNPDIERQTNFETAGQFTADAVNLELDTHTSFMQWIKTKLSRSIQLADDAESTATLTVAAPDDNANKFLKVNASGTGYDYVSIAATSTVSNYEKQFFNGTGVADTFTLTAFTPVDADQIEVVVDNATQYPVEDYTISGNDIVFESGSIPASGTNNIFVRNLANGSLTTTPADNSVSTAKIQANAVTAAKIDADFVVDYTDTVITASDLILFGDVSDTNNTKRDTVQGVIDLVPADLFGKSAATITASDKIVFADASDSDNPKTDTVQGLIDLMPFSQAFVSSEQTISNGGLITVPHGLGATPILVDVSLVCKTAELGYAIGEVVRVNGLTSGTTGLGYSSSADSTNVYLQVGSSGIAIHRKSATAGISTTITNSSWRVLLKAWA